MQMDSKRLIGLIKKDEGIKLDFKQLIDTETESGRKELAKDVCAIANSKGGRGYLIIGIEDKTKRITGVDEAEYTEEQIQQIVSSRTEPPIPVSFQYIRLANKYIGVITIYDSPQSPFQLRENGSFFIRRGSTTDTMRKQELISAFQDNMTLNTEICPILSSSLKNIDNTIVDKYFSSMGITLNDDNRLELMENASIVIKDKESGDYMATLGGVLVFCTFNNIFIPHNMVRIINKINRNFDEMIIVKGDLLNILDRCEEHLIKLLPPDYPVDAVYEAVKNAVLYRDYTVYYKEIEINLNKNNISVISPGILLKSGNDISLSNRNYQKRNMWIYEKLIAIDNKKRFMNSGQGLSKMKKAFKSSGRVIFINSSSDNSFKVVFPGARNM